MFRKNDSKKDKSDQINLVLLKTVDNNIKLGIFKAILDDKNIPYIIKDYGAGGHMRIIAGDSKPFRTDILVDEDTYGEAKDLIDQIAFDE